MGSKVFIACMSENIYTFPSLLKDYLDWWFSEVPQIFFSGCGGGKGKEKC